MPAKKCRKHGCKFENAHKAILVKHGLEHITMRHNKILVCEKCDGQFVSIKEFAIHEETCDRMCRRCGEISPEGRLFANVHCAMRECEDSRLKVKKPKVREICHQDYYTGYYKRSYNQFIYSFPFFYTRQQVQILNHASKHLS